MLERLIEYRESQQYRKERLNKEKMRQARWLFAVCLALLLVMAAVESVKPAPVAKKAHHSAPSKPVKTDKVPDAQQEELDEIKEFAAAVTKPLETLDKDDLDLVESKAGDPCYENNASLPADEMVTAITACKLTPKGK